MDTSPEATAARLRRVYACTSNGDVCKVYGVRKWDAAAWRREQDERALARQWIAERPADDAEPVTVPWLESAGFSVASYPSHFLADRGLDEQTGWHLWLRIRLPIMEAQICHGMAIGESDGIALTRASVRTRGDIRRLLAALGIT